MEAPAHVLDAVRDALPDPDESVLVALSGGADSAAVAWASIEVLGAEHVRLIHIDHGLPDSWMLRAAAESVAERLGIALIVVPVDISGAGSEETRARAARLAALEAAVHGDEWIVTGHHRGDAVETVLGNLLRGAGAVGLSGITPRRDKYLRPMLSIPADVVRRAADELRLPYQDDPANRDLRHRRNVVRDRLLPGLESDLGMDVRSALYRTSQILSADDAVLDAQASSVPIVLDAGAALLPAPALAMLPRPIAARIIRRAFRMVRPPYPGSSAEIESVMEAALGGGTQALLAGWYAVREGVHVALVPALELQEVEPAMLIIPGSAGFGHGHFLSGDTSDEPVGLRRRRDIAVLDAETSGVRFEVRSADRGERIDIGDGSKTVRDALAEAGVPVRHRATWPVVAVSGRIAWVPGARVAPWAQAHRNVSHTVVLHWERKTE